jgi:predicted nucleotidyltransferase
MAATSHDFSLKAELAPLAGVVKALEAVTTVIGTEFFLTGAAARDLTLHHAHGVPVGRQTEDVDFAVMVNDWNAFIRLRQALIDSGEFTPRPGSATHRLRHRAGLPLDIVPFGAIERADRTIAWPPDHSTVFDCFGASEAFANCLWVKLPDEVVTRVASIPSLAILKIAAWHDRKLTFPGKDAPDLALIFRNYLSCGTMDRAATDHGDLFDDPAFDYEIAGTRLLGRDVAILLDEPGIARLLAILIPESDPDGSLLLARQSGIDLDTMRTFVDAMCKELTARLKGNSAITAP